MEAFTMEIAGLVVGVQPMFQSTREYCRPYLTEKVPQFFVEVTPEDLIFQQELLAREAVLNGLKIRKFQDPFLERATIQRRVSDALVSQNALMLHGSTVAVDGNAYLFAAPCKTGKSTHTRLWREVFGPRAVMVNDDMPILKLTPDGVLAYGSPWCGKHGLGSNICVPLRGICFLQRGQENEIYPIRSSDGLPLLMQQKYSLQDAALLPQTRYLVERIATRVPLWKMYCNTDPEAAHMAYNAMCGNAENDSNY